MFSEGEVALVSNAFFLRKEVRAWSGQAPLQN